MFALPLGVFGSFFFCHCNSSLTSSVLVINPFMPSEFFYFNLLNRFIFYIRGVWLAFIFFTFCRRFVASDLGLHCLPMSHIWDVRLIWVNGMSRLEESI